MLLQSLKVLLWKHLMVRKRRIILTLAELLSTGALNLFIVYLLINNDSFKKTKAKKLEFYVQEVIDAEPVKVSQFYYHPHTTLSEKLLSGAEKRLPVGMKGLLPVNKTRREDGIWSVSNHMQFLTLVNLNKTDFAGIVFENLDEDEWPNRLKYTLQFNEPFQTYTYKAETGYHEYFAHSYADFVAIQWAIDTSFIEQKSNETITQRLSTQHFPVLHLAAAEPHNLISFIEILVYISMLTPMILFLYLQTHRMNEERTSGIQELIQMSGIGKSYIYVAHAINAVPCLLLFSISGATVGEMSHSGAFMHWFLVLFTYFLYIMAVAFFFSLLFSKPSYSIVFLVIYNLAVFGVGMALNAKILTSPKLKYVYHLVPNVPLMQFGDAVKNSMKNWEKVRWMKWTKYGTPTLVAVAFQLVQVLIFTGIGILVREFFPGKYGIARTFDFFKKEKASGEEDIEMQFESHKKEGHYFEEPPTNLQAGISVHKVTKIFGKGDERKVALYDINLNIYAGEITVLLGHNGAGKTTLMSIITGMYGPTSGKIFVKGKDFLKHRSTLTKSMGLCPQHNLLFNDLTVRQHLIFFGMVKSLSRKEAEEVSDTLLEDLKLTEKESMLIKELSGGMLRRLQLGCAMVGDPEVLILDEPTSGLDVEARRFLWDLILGLRGNCTVLLTTHFMEEADALGDRVAALHSGELRCYGSPMFLKKAIGEGYRLTLNLDRNYDRDAITNEIKSVVQRAEVKTATANSMMFSLPMADHDKFSKLFTNLEKEKQQLKIRNLVLGVTTLEEVFLKLCIESEVQEEDETREEPTIKNLVGNELYIQQAKALFLRQFKYYANKKIIILFMEVILPLILLIYLQSKLNNDLDYRSKNKNPPRAMNLDIYNGGPTKIFYNIELPNADQTLNMFKKKYPNFQFVHADDINKAIIKAGYEGRDDYDDVLLGLELNETNANVLYTSTLRHALPVGVNLLTNLLAAVTAPRLADPADPQLITTVNHPVVRPVAENIFIIPKTPEDCRIWIFFQVILLTAIISGVTAVAFAEHASSTRHIYIMSGVPMLLYYAVMLLVHMLVFTALMTIALLLSTLAFERDKTIDSTDFILLAIFISILYAMALILLIYIVSFYMSQTYGLVLAIFLVIVFGDIFPYLLIKCEAPLGHIARLFPVGNYHLGLHKLMETARFNGVCTLNKQWCPNEIEMIPYPRFDPERCCKSTKTRGYMGYFSYYSFMSGPELEVLTLCLQIIVFATLLYFIQRGTIAKWMSKIISESYKAPRRRFDDPIVEAERKYVDEQAKHGAEATTREDAALVHEVHKYYNSMFSEPHYGVSGVSFSVKPGECFGLLGVNGAGKTSVFKMMTGLENITRGEIYANGYQQSKDLAKYLSTITYCPQHGGVDGFLTGWDNIKLMAIIRGVPPSHLHDAVSAAIARVNLQVESKRITEKYSGGCERRCITAAALVGAQLNESGRFLAVLDEPTAGVDPGAKRHVWAALRHGLRRKLSIVISSHSMDETELLCDRIAIMARGQIGALGSATQLRDAYATGYTVNLKLKEAIIKETLRQGIVKAVKGFRGSKNKVDTVPTTPAAPKSRPPSKQRVGSVDEASGPGSSRRGSIEESIERIKAVMEKQFKCELKDQHLNFLQYVIHDDIGYGHLFERMDRIKQAHGDMIEDYTICGTTLEEVFLSFAKESETSHQTAQQ